MTRDMWTYRCSLEDVLELMHILSQNRHADIMVDDWSIVEPDEILNTGADGYYAKEVGYIFNSNTWTGFHSRRGTSS